MKKPVAVKSKKLYLVVDKTFNDYDAVIYNSKEDIADDYAKSDDDDMTNTFILEFDEKDLKKFSVSKTINIKIG